MKNIIKLNLTRIFANKGYLLTYLILTPIITFLAILFTNNIDTNLVIGIVNNEEYKINNDSVVIKYIDEMPKTSELALNKYDAVIVFDGEDYEITNTKNEDIEELVVALMQGIDVEISDNSREILTNIFGFNMMVILLLGVQLYTYYFDERKGINTRILSTEISTTTYLLSHFIVVLMFLFIPSCIVYNLAMFIFNIGTVSIVLNANLVLFVICLFATSFGLLINTNSKNHESAVMNGNMIAIITTILSGSLVAVTDNEILSSITKFLPQTNVINFLTDLEASLNLNYNYLIYIFILSIIFIIIGIISEKKQRLR